MSAGSFIGGYLFETIGGSYTFRLFGIAALVFFVLHVVIQKMIVKCACTSGKAANGGRADGGELNNPNDVEVIEVYRSLPPNFNEKA